MMTYYLVGILVLGLITVIVVGEFRTWKVQSDPRQKLFLSGHLPVSAPDGLYTGTVVELKTDWQGKKFDATNSAGVNIFKKNDQEMERFPFKTAIGKGVVDKNLDVFKIDYSQTRDDWWVRFVLDEVVELAPGKFLGKVHLRIIPGLPFAMGYFELEK